MIKDILLGVLAFVTLVGVEWLEELKEYRKIKAQPFYDKGWTDAIDEFVKECVKFEDLTFDKGHIHRIKMIAEQLKEHSNDNNGTN